MLAHTDLLAALNLVGGAGGLLALGAEIVINCGCSELRENPKVLDSIMGDLMKITGQRPGATQAPQTGGHLTGRW